jgi:Cu+-exporting ATPase
MKTATPINEIPPDSSEATHAPEAARTDLPLLGMHCAACATRIEKALNRAEGVETCSVNFATTRATVHYDPQTTNPVALREVVKQAGYDAIVQESAQRVLIPMTITIIRRMTAPL